MLRELAVIMAGFLAVKVLVIVAAEVIVAGYLAVKVAAKLAVKMMLKTVPEARKLLY